MKVGSLVEAQHDFDDVRKEWGLPYPYKGNILTVSHMEKHHAVRGGFLLWFEELDLPTGLSDKQVDGTWNFKELLPPEQQIDANKLVEDIVKEKRKEIKILKTIQDAGYKRWEKL